MTRSASRPGGGRCEAAVAVALLMAGAEARAADFPGPVRWSGSLTVASETVRRGIAWSGGRAAVDAEIDAVTDRGWRASLGVDTPAYPEIGARAGWTLGAGRGWQFDTDWSGQASVTRYALAGRRAARDAGYVELGVSAAWQGRAFVTAAISPDRRGYDVDAREMRSGSTAAVEVGAAQRLAGRLSLDAGAGVATVVAGRRRDYAYGSVGLRWGAGPVQVQLGWVVSQAASRGVAPAGEAGSRVVAAASCAF